jgi:hypothetical protein
MTTLLRTAGCGGNDTAWTLLLAGAGRATGSSSGSAWMMRGASTR